MVNYELRGSGFPQDKKYELWLGISFQKPVHTKFVFHVNSMGEIVNEAGRISRFSVGNYHKGEPCSVGLISTDGSIKAFAKVYPFPLQASDGPCHLTLEMLTSDGKTFGVIGRGFPPNRVVESVSQSGSEVIRGQQQVNKNGDFGAVVLPANVSGDTRASYGINSSACKVKVDYEWGGAALVPQ